MKVLDTVLITDLFDLFYFFVEPLNCHTQGDLFVFLEEGHCRFAGSVEQCQCGLGYLDCFVLVYFLNYLSVLGLLHLFNSINYKN